MVRVRHVGLGDKEAAVRAFDELRPLVAHLAAMKLKCKPFGRDYHAICVSLDALDTTAYHFIRRPHFYGGCDDAVSQSR